MCAGVTRSVSAWNIETNGGAHVKFVAMTAGGGVPIIIVHRPGELVGGVVAIYRWLVRAPTASVCASDI